MCTQVVTIQLPTDRSTMLALVLVAHTHVPYIPSQCSWGQCSCTGERSSQSPPGSAGKCPGGTGPLQQTSGQAPLHSLTAAHTAAGGWQSLHLYLLLNVRGGRRATYVRTYVSPQATIKCQDKCKWISRAFKWLYTVRVKKKCP